MARGSGRQRPLASGDGDGDDLPPSGEEAQAQRKATVKPLIWLLLGVVLVAAFVAVLRVRTPFDQRWRGPTSVPAPALAAPPHKPVIGGAHVNGDDASLRGDRHVALDERAEQLLYRELLGYVPGSDRPVDLFV